MTTIRGHILTLEEFLALPEEKPALEYFEGEVTRKVWPLGRHSRLQCKLSEFISTSAEPRKLAMVFTEIRGTFAGASRVPDIGVYRWERIPRTEDGRIADYFLTPPDIAIEIISPSQTWSELAKKCRWYVANGAVIALLVDDRRYTVTRFTQDGEERLTGDARIDLDLVLPSFDLTVRALLDTLRID